MIDILVGAITGPCLVLAVLTARETRPTFFTNMAVFLLLYIVVLVTAIRF